MQQKHTAVHDVILCCNPGTTGPPMLLCRFLHVLICVILNGIKRQHLHAQMESEAAATGRIRKL